jgi:hypothetical protein
MFVLEPIPQLSAMLLSLRLAKVQETPLGPDVGRIDASTKTAKSSDRRAWLQIYASVAQLIPRIVEQYSRPAQLAAVAAPAQAHRISTVIAAAQTALQRASSDWTARLSTQEKDLARKASQAAEHLPVVSNVDESVGDLVFTYDPTQLGAYWRWLGDAERMWAMNNGVLVAHRAQESILDTLGEIPTGQAFRIVGAPLEPTAAPPPRLKGHRIPNPGFFQSLGATYRFVMSGVTAVSGLGFFATRVLGGGAARLVPIALGAVFVATVIVAAITLPKQRRQSMARLKVRAQEVLQRELEGAVRDRLKMTSDLQFSTIKKHLTAEAVRLKSSFREGAPAAVAPQPAPMFSAGLSPADVDRLRGEWKSAIEQRIQQLEGELASGKP